MYGISLCSIQDKYLMNHVFSNNLYRIVQKIFYANTCSRIYIVISKREKESVYLYVCVCV